MKPKIISIFLLFCGIGLSAFAQKSKLSEPVSRVINVKERLTSLIVEDDISVILTETSANDIVIVGEDKELKNLQIRLNENELSLFGLHSNSTSGVKVYVPASFLTKVIVNSKAELTSAGVLSNPFLKVVVAGEGKIQLRSIGKLIIEETDGYDFIRMTR